MTDKLPVQIVTQYMQTVPVQVFDLARALGLNVREDFLVGDISGKIERIGADKYQIVINASHSRTRRRFTAAHEIAHFILHRDLIGDSVIDDGLYRSSLSDPIERQANKYAADILMPWWHVRKVYRNGTTAPSDLAAYFDVSPAVAEIRVRELSGALRV